MTNSCTYHSKNGSPCREIPMDGSDLCRWHSPAGPGPGPGQEEQIRPILEEIAREGRSMAGFNLRRLDLHNISLINTDLEDADFTRASLSNAHLYGANLKGAILFKTDLSNANLRATCLEDVNLLGANLEQTKFDMARWGKDFVLKNEKEGMAAQQSGNRQLSVEKYREAEEIYRNIKLSLRDQGHSRDESPFFHREKIMQRKQMVFFSPARLLSKFMDITTGYGERPLNVLATMLVVIFLAALLYGVFGVQQGGFTLSFTAENPEGLMNTIGNLLYFSTVVFTTVGFGDIIPHGFSKMIMMVQGITGQVLIAFFIVALYRKMMNR